MPLCLHLSLTPLILDISPLRPTLPRLGLPLQHSPPTPLSRHRNVFLPLFSPTPFLLAARHLPVFSRRARWAAHSVSAAFRPERCRHLRSNHPSSHHYLLPYHRSRRRGRRRRRCRRKGTSMERRSYLRGRSGSGVRLRVVGRSTSNRTVSNVRLLDRIPVKGSIIDSLFL